jgi:hypothetical protein
MSRELGTVKSNARVFKRVEDTVTLAGYCGPGGSRCLQITVKGPTMPPEREIVTAFVRLDFASVRKIHDLLDEWLHDGAQY